MFANRTARRGRRWNRLVAAPLGAVALVALAACGTSTGASAASGASDGGAAGSTTANGSASGDASTGRPSDAAMQAYASCLKENGVTLPEPPAGRGGGGTPPQDGGTPPSGAPGDGQQGADQQGGGPGGPGGTPGQAPPGVDADTWAAAQKACADLAPTPPGGTAGSTGT